VGPIFVQNEKLFTGGTMGQRPGMLQTHESANAVGGRLFTGTTKGCRKKGGKGGKDKECCEQAELGGAKKRSLETGLRKVPATGKKKPWKIRGRGRKNKRGLFAELMEHAGGNIDRSGGGQQCTGGVQREKGPRVNWEISTKKVEFLRRKKKERTGKNFL